MKCDQFKIHFDVIFLTLSIIIRLMIIETCSREGWWIMQLNIRLLIHIN